MCGQTQSQTYCIVLVFEENVHGPATCMIGARFASRLLVPFTATMIGISMIPKFTYMYTK